ncbi:hypothetical protein KQX54_003155 [Cotesia glomerata]|uniref:Uncharacterized protein n=1 Tax=Cotesia glomerata TaxID=32391 RepID=A0AAV7ILQ9_COTGL|nr:hypothetical protein KQX54_003155 [Cotesia glomerata]
MDKRLMFLLILFVIELTHSKPQENKTLGAWEINFDGNLFSEENCEAVLISPQSLLAEAECVQRGLNISDAHISVNYRHVLGVYVNVATINKSNVHFSEGIKENLNIIVSKIALLITDQPVISSDYSKLSTAALVLTYNDPCGYKEENLIVEMALSNDGLIDFTHCFVPAFNETDINVSPCKALDDNIFCTYNKEMRDKNLRLRNFVYCQKKSGEEKFVIGMLMEKTINDLKGLSDSEMPEKFFVESLIASGYIYF